MDYATAVANEVAAVQRSRPGRIEFASVQPTKEAVLEAAKNANVEFVHLQFTDLLGMIKAVTIPVNKLEGAIDDHVWFDGSSIQGFTRIFESDMMLKLDLGTFSVIPWTAHTKHPVARIICDVCTPDGSPFEGDPRYILKKQIKKMQSMGFDNYFVGPELEFFLFKRQTDGSLAPLPHDSAGYFDMSTDRAGYIRQEMTEDLRAMGVEVEMLHHEVAEGQHEINFRFSDAVKSADNALTLKYILKAVAHRHGLHATFMPKPIAGINGTGMHVHQSLFTAGDNAFYDATDQYNLSKTAGSFIAGQLKYIREINAVTNPIINSYKRLVPGYEAPVYISWARQNRSALIRIPKFTGDNPKAVRCELRCPDPSGNPYLTFAVMLAAGLKGIEEGLEAPAPSEETNLYKLSESELEEHGIRTLCGSLEEALHCFKKSALAKETLGEHTFNQYVAAKKEEVDAYRLHVSSWETDRYIEKY